jgi:hypothetical protein
MAMAPSSGRVSRFVLHAARTVGGEGGRGKGGGAGIDLPKRQESRLPAIAFCGESDYDTGMRVFLQKIPRAC